MISVPCPEGARCARCEQLLVTGSIVVVLHPHPGGTYPRDDYFHPRCAVDVSAYWAKLALELGPAFDGRDALVALAALRERARQAAIYNKPIPEVEPAADPLGRPRVTALLVGSAFNQRAWDQFVSRVRYHTWRSSLREYVFAWIGASARWQDPSRPVGAAVFAARVDKKVVKAQLDRLIEVRAMGVTTPVVWLIGDAVSADREAYFREPLQRAGFDGDNAILVRGPAAIDAHTVYEPALLDALCAAMDPPTR